LEFFPVLTPGKKQAKQILVLFSWEGLDWVFQNKVKLVVKGSLPYHFDPAWCGKGTSAVKILVERVPHASNFKLQCLNGGSYLLCNGGACALVLEQCLHPSYELYQQVK
jgi:hypothetical protein